MALHSVLFDSVRAVIWDIDIADVSEIVVLGLRQRGILNFFCGEAPDKSLFFKCIGSDDPVGAVSGDYRFPDAEILYISGKEKIGEARKTHPLISTSDSLDQILLLDCPRLGNREFNVSGASKAGASMNADDLSRYSGLIAREDSFYEAMDILRKSCSEGRTWSGLELADQLLRHGTQRDCDEAFAICYRNRNGDDQFKYRLGKMYASGKGARRDLNKAAEYLSAAESGGVPDSMESLVDVLIEINSPESLEKARMICERYGRKNPSATAKLAKMYYEGKGVTRNIDEAVDLMRQASASGIGWICNGLIDMLIQRGSPEDCSEAMALAEKRTRGGDLWSQARLARMYRDGKGTGKDLDTAISLMESAYSGNVQFAGPELAEMLVQRGTEKDLGMFREMMAGGRSDSPATLVCMARFYRDGTVVEKDPAKALKLMREAYSRGAAGVRNELTDMLLAEETRACNKEAFAVASGNPSDPWTAYRLSRMYRDGIGTRADLDKAIELMREARNGGVRSAIGELDDMLVARGRPEDLREAFDNEQAEAGKGNVWAYGRLARMYRDGKGAGKDPAKAEELMRKAYEGGVSWAGDELELMLGQDADKNGRKSRCRIKFR